MQRDDAQALILDHWQQPRFRAVLAAATGAAQAHNPVCGDRVQVQVEVQDGVITALGWDGRGCALSQAMASVLSEAAQGEAVQAVQGWDEAMLWTLLGMAIQGTRRRCAGLALEAVQGALAAPAPHGTI